MDNIHTNTCKTPRPHRRTGGREFSESFTPVSLFTTTTTTTIVNGAVTAGAVECKGAREEEGVRREARSVSATRETS